MACASKAFPLDVTAKLTAKARDADFIQTSFHESGLPRTCAADSQRR